MDATLASGYSSPKQGILRFLKRSPGASLADVAAEIGVSKAAALGHLQKLERDALIARSYRAGKVGRPRVVFQLTGGASALFPHNYTEMSLCALEFIERRLGRTAVSELLTQRAHDVADRSRARLRTGPLGARVDELARIRTEGGYMAEVGPRARGAFELLEHNCPVLAIAGRYPEACETERRMFESMLGARVETSHRVVAGDAVCRFRIRDRSRDP